MVQDGLRPDLVVTDHLMPGMTGLDLARDLRASRPDLPVVIVSGYAEMEGVAPSFPRLTKPFRSAELATCLTTLAEADAGTGHRGRASPILAERSMTPPPS
jgi:CheY-like chemotaxis protein